MANLQNINKKVYLLYPPISKEERYSSEIGSAGGTQIPLGIYYVAAYLRENGFEIMLSDAEAENLQVEDILKQIHDFNPRYVGISSTTVAFHRALETANGVKDLYPDKIIILGGPHITSNVEHAMSFNVFDYGVIREGEITMVKLLETLISEAPLDNINGIAYRSKSDELKVAPAREYIHNLDTLPFPAYDLIRNIDNYAPPPCNYKTLPVINIITSRGCPYQCTFCDKNSFGNGYRQRSPENMVKEIKYLRDTFSVREIAFVDDTFLLNKERIYRLFELLDRENIKFHWTCMSFINNIDIELLKYIKDKGCWHISFGIESGDREILKTIRKNITLEKCERVISWCRQLKIKTKGFFILGHPGETRETIERTIDFASKLKLDDIVVTINTPIPGTQQYAEATKYGTLDETDWSQYNYWRPVFLPFGMTRELLLEKHREIYRRFYLRPRILIRYLLSIFSRGGCKRLFTIMKASRFLLAKKNPQH